MKNTQNIQLIKQRDTSTDLTHKIDFVDELVLRSADIPHNKYGNMLVVIETQRILVTLGPDYLCFIITFVGFIVADYFLISFVNSGFDSIWFKIINALIALIQLASYLLVAVSNPGIQLAQNAFEDSNQTETEQTTKYCLKCKIRMQRKVRHCKRCDVCIRDYDHHCPWVSKCIGQGNIRRFNFFLCLTPFYIMYFMVVLMISSALSLEKNN